MRIGIQWLLAGVLGLLARAGLAADRVEAGPGGILVLDASTARLEGQGLKLETVDGRVNIGFWSNLQDRVVWSAAPTRPGTYQMELEYSCIPSCAGSEIEIWVGPSLAAFRTGSPGSGWTSYGTVSVGAVDIEKAAPLEVTVKAVKKTGFAVINIRRITLKPAAPPR